MKASITPVDKEKKFGPFDLTIRVENKDELGYLYEIFGVSPTRMLLRLSADRLTTGKTIDPLMVYNWEVWRRLAHKIKEISS